jgi:alcohol dehydrogenase class IV
VALLAGECDCLVAFGGVSPIDTAKAMAVLAAGGGKMRDYKVPFARADGIAKLIAIPTTAGTGSEVGRAVVITDEAAQVKRVIFHPRMLPALVLADPALTVGLSPRLTAATGMDAFAHCLEAYCAIGFHPIADGVALNGLRLLHDWLPVAVADGSSLVARAHVMAAASMGAAAFQKGLGAIHALSHPVGAVLDAHHGETNGVFLPYVLAFNRAAIEERSAALARLLGLARADFAGFLAWTLMLRARIGIPHTPAALGLKPEHVARFARMAAADPTAAGNPVPLDVEALRGLYERALAGEVATPA